MNTDWDSAVAFTEKERAELRQAEPDSRPLGPGEVAGETVVSLISTGTELAKYQGLLEGAEFPLYPGYAAVFEVTEVGSEVEGIAPGELVCCFGNHRSRQRAEVGQVSPVPRGLAPQEAAFARLMVVGLSALATMRARPPDLVAVLGLGPIGHLAAKVFDSCGYRLLVCDPDSSRREIAAQAGLTAMARLPLDDPEVAGQVALVLECSGHEQAALDGCKIVAKEGEVVLMGVPWARQTELFAHDLLYPIFHRYVVVRSGWEWKLPMQPQEFRTGSIYGNLAAALRWLAEERVSVAGLYEEVSPHDAQETYQRLLHKEVERLAVVFDWTRVS